MSRQTMEQSCNSPVTAEEIEVVEILRELPRLILESESRPRFTFKWGAKRRRSAASKEEFASTSLPAVELSRSPSPPLPSKVVGPTYETERPTEKPLTSSPATPLSFSPSESDEKPLPSKKKASVNSLKRKKEQLLEMVEDLTQRNQLLKKDIESKRLFLDQQKAKNLELKLKKQELSLSLCNAKESHSDSSKSLNLATQSTQISMETAKSQDHQQLRISTMVYQQPFTMDQTVSISETKKNSQYPYGRMISWLPSNNGLSKVHEHDSMVPLGLLDLNVSAEEAFGFCSSKSFDMNSTTKARAAQARFKRMQICRSKNQTAGWKARYPFR
ncbi:hypothetical protein POUND7_018284 [Theobroma cacao]